MKSLHISE